MTCGCKILLNSKTRSLTSISLDISNTFWTPVALVIRPIVFPVLLERYTMFNIDVVHVATILVSGLHIFGMTCPPTMRWSFIIHRICVSTSVLWYHSGSLIYPRQTLLAIIFLQTELQVTSHPAIAAAGLIWLFQATTEQSVFIGLFMYMLPSPNRLSSQRFNSLP